LAVLFSFESCKPQERVVESISCQENIIIQYDKTTVEAKKEGRTADKKLEAFTVYFLNDFDDYVKGYVNNKLLFDEKIQTNNITSDTDKYFGYNYSKDIESPILKISINEKECFDVEIDKRYKLIYVFLTKEGKFIVRFSNQYYLHD